MSKNNIPPLYFVYRHIRHDINEVFYIGRGRVYLYCNNHDGSFKSCYWRAFATEERNPFWKNVVNKTTYDVEIIWESTNFSLINEKEKEFIKLYGRRDLGEGTLTNLSDGGDGPINMSKHSIEKLIKTQIDSGLYERFREERQHDFYIYDLSGKFIKYVKNNIECADFVGCAKHTINLYCRERLSINGYFLARKYFEDGLDISKYRVSKRKRYNILKYDENFTLVAEYDHIKDAVKKDETSESSIIRGLRKGHFSGGAYWRRGNVLSTQKIKKIW